MEIDNKYGTTLIIALTEYQNVLKKNILDGAEKERNGETQPDFFESCIINNACFYERVNQILEEVIKKEGVK